jgi:hypothetical protein
MKEKIIAAFKAKYPGINLSKARLAAIAAKIEAKVIDDETKVDAALAAMDDAYAFADIAKDDDKIRTLEAKVKPPKADETPAEKLAREKAEAASKEPKLPDDVPDYIKAIIEQNKAIAAQLQAIQGEKVATTYKTKATELLKDVPVSYWGKRAIPDNDEALQAFVTEVTADYTAFKQEMTDAGLNILSAPRAGGAGGAGDKAVSPEIKAFVEKQAAPAKATA